MSKLNSEDTREAYTVSVPFRKPRFMGRDSLPTATTWGPIEVIDLTAPRLEARTLRPRAVRRA